LTLCDPHLTINLAAYKILVVLIFFAYFYIEKHRK